MLNGFSFLKNERFVVHVDIEIVKKAILRFELAEDERILLLIDDSLFRNREYIYVLTNKRLLWNTRKSTVKKHIVNKTTASSRLEETGPNEIDIKDVGRCSLFIDKYGACNIITIIDEVSQVHLYFQNITDIETLKIIFIDYLSNYVNNFAYNEQQNLIKYKKARRVLSKKHTNPLSLFLNIAAIVIVALMLGEKLFYTSSFIANNTVTFTIAALFFKIVSIFLSNKKSFYSNLVAYLFFSFAFYKGYTLPVPGIGGNELFFFTFSVLFYIIDFDKLLKFITVSGTLFFTVYLFYFSNIS